MIVDPVTWRSTRPRKRMGAGVLVRDSHGRVLLVEPTYKATWELPGGGVEADESPRVACAREVEEELGLRLQVGRLLCLEWQGPVPDRTESIMFVYDGGVRTHAALHGLATGALVEMEHGIVLDPPIAAWPDEPVRSRSAPRHDARSDG